MPLLKKKPFEKADLPQNLRDDEEVFYCEMTNEIFRDYEEFSERMFLCNSMVWTCSMTGKSNLTYMEAMESEENAKKSLKEFPTELKVPILYLASKTKRSSFTDMAEDVFIFAKDRFFIGENVETSFTSNKWKDSHVLQVIAPSPEQIKKSHVKNGNNGERHFFPPASLYKYEIEHLDAYDEDISEIMIVDCNQIRRKKGTFTKERCKLFLKQYTVQDDKGVFYIDPAVLEQFGIDKMKFDQIFSGSLPNFDVSKKLEKGGSATKKPKQVTLSKFLSKGASGNTEVKENKLSLLEQMKKREEEFKLKKQQKEEEKLALKQKKKEDNLKLAAHLKDWYKTREDLELENLKKLPLPAPVKSRVPDKHFGDMLMILEFVDTFPKLLFMKDYFPGGLTLELLERALVEKEVAGPLTDIIQMFLTAIFNQQDEEASQYTTQVEETSDIKKEDVPENMSLHEATRLATLASKWSNRHQGLPLSRLPLYSLTVSEILRLHLLSSGARINENGAKWRFQERGGYTSEDDPGLYLCLHQPHIVKALAMHNVVQLPLGDKLQIISCLIDQLLTYADVRDVVEEKLEKTRQVRAELKLLQIAERKRDQEFQATRMKMKKQMKEDNSIKESDVEKLERDAERKKAENEKKINKLLKACYEKQAVIGWDRAHRKYLKLESVPGVFVNREEKVPGECLKEPVKQVAALVGADRVATVTHFRKLYEDLNSSDKENNPKSGHQMNGMVNGHPNDFDELFTCSADPETCIVHSDKNKQRWYFFHDKEQINELEESLNKRGIRESELRTVVQNEKEVLCNLVSRTPVSQLNPDIEVEETEPKPVAKPKKGKARYEDANLGYPPEMNPEQVLHNALVDNILEMEEKIFAGSLGYLKVKDREAWRACLASKKYDEMDKTVIKRERENGKLQKVKKEDNSRPNTPEVSNEPDIYQDPGRFLGTTLQSDLKNSESDEDETLDRQSDDLKTAINSLAVALIQVAQAVEPKYLKKPLGHADISKNDKKKDYNVIDKWEQSLLASTSFSQVFLHYGTLDSCVMWSRSALLARCRICRRQRDSENMLLCDSCNLGHHLYCLKPKLTAIPQGDWYCTKCTLEREKQKKLENPPEEPPKKKRRIFTDEEVEEESSSEESEQLDVDSNSESSSHSEERIPVKLDVCKVCGSGGELLCCDKCSNHYHLECVRPVLRRAPRGSWLCTACKEADKKKESKESSSSGSEDDTVVTRRSHHRTDEGRYDLPLHNAALQELLSDVMKHRDAWAFLRPVQKNEVPDYYEVIEKPMDFGTLKYKLNMGEYREDSQFMADAVLIFENCNTYNHSDDEVYKCGVRLLAHFIKKCKELGLRLPEEMENDFEDDDDEDTSEKNSTDEDSSNDDDQPKSKKSRTK